MTTVTVVTGGAHAATSYTGSGSGLTGIPLSALSTGTPNNVVITNGGGNYTTAATLSTALGGTGQNLSGVTGPAIITVSGGAIASSLVYTTAATANAIVQRDVSGNIAAAAGTFTSLSSPSLATASGNLSLSPFTGITSIGTGSLQLAPVTVAGGNVTFTSANVQTTNATTTTLFSYATASGGSHGTAYYIQCAIAFADNTGGVNTGSYSFNFKAKNIGGTITNSGISNLESILDSGLSTTAVAVSTTGSNVLVQVTGIAATNINWCGTFQISGQTF